MNKNQLLQVMEYLDAEYAGIVSRMAPEERSARLRHWSREIGALDFDSAMTAVKVLARGQYMPRTAEILAEVERSRAAAKTGKQTVRIFRDDSGAEILDVRENGETVIGGYLESFPEWMQAKFRWLSGGDPADWDAYISAHEERAAAEEHFPEVDALMAMVEAA